MSEVPLLFLMSEVPLSEMSHQKAAMPLQGYLAYAKQPSPLEDHHRA